MRNMAFSMTIEQMRNGSKDVTRRLGWDFLKAGDQVMAVEKSQGLKKGEKVVRLFPIEIVSVRGEAIREITTEEVVREGFPEMNVREFVSFFCTTHRCQPADLVNRIEFRRAE